MRCAGILMSMVVACALAGCGPKFEKTFPVSGSLTVDEEPAKRAEVVFHPVGDVKGRVKPVAVVGEDGNFTMTTFLTGDGAPPGEYMVTVVWRKYHVVEGEEVEGDDMLYGQYNDLRSPFLKVTVKPGENKLPPMKLTLK